MAASASSVPPVPVGVPAVINGGAGTDPESSGKQLKSPRTTWGLTWNNYPGDFKEKLVPLFHLCHKYSIQSEVGEKGTKHLQGAFVFETKHKKRWTWLTKQIPGYWFVPTNINALLNYCMKKETHDGVFSATHGVAKNNEKWKPKDYYDESKATDWMKHLDTVFESEPDPRVVHWYWSKTGGIGKTTYARHICINNEDAILVSGKSADIKYAIQSMIEEAKIRPRIVFINIPRRWTSEFVSYTAIEELKDGIFFATKYKGAMCIFDPPHVVVFANDEPDVSSLSADRWDIRCLDEPVSDVSDGLLHFESN